MDYDGAELLAGGSLGVVAGDGLQFGLCVVVVVKGLVVGVGRVC